MNSNPIKNVQRRCANNKENFATQKNDYFTALKDFPIPEINNESPLRIIYSAKQAECGSQIAIYKNISFFEAVNRIATDFVFWQGIDKILEELSWENINSLSYCLGNENSPKHGDFTIKLGEEELEGEVFFVAPSYFPVKIKKTLEKWKNQNLKYILFNSNACSKETIEKLKEKNKEIYFIPVELSENF